MLASGLATAANSSHGSSDSGVSAAACSARRRASRFSPFFRAMYAFRMSCWAEFELMLIVLQRLKYPRFEYSTEYHLQSP